MLPVHRNEQAPEFPRGRFRKLRIAWSVGWGVLAVLLIVLWVRSLVGTDVWFVIVKNGLFTNVESVLAPCI